MKKLSAVLLCFLVAATCVACGNNDTDTTTKKQTKSATSSTQDTGSGNSGSMTSSDASKNNTEHSDTDDTSADKNTNNTLTTAENTPTEDSSDSSLSADGISITYGDYVISVLGCEETTDINNCPALRATYSFTNNSEKQAAFSTTAVTYAYQNDYRLANSSPSGLDEEYSAQLQLVEPGQSITCAAYYLLDNTDDDVRIEVTNLLNSSDDILSLRYSFGAQTNTSGQ